MLPLLLLAVAPAVVATYDDLIVEPLPNKSGEPSLLLFAQGAQIKTGAYLPLIQEIQRQFPSPLWAGAPQCPGDVAAIPGCLDSGFERIKIAMQKKGMPSTINSVFYSGHSLGGAMIPAYVQKKAETAKGMILLGAFLTRSFRTGRTKEGTPQVEFPVPTLTIGGELDGLARITRMAEAFETQVEMSALDHPQRTLPVTILKGVSHLQFASGDPPFLVKKRDLRPEVTLEEAHKAIAADMVAYMNALLAGDSSTKTWAGVESRVQESHEILAPIIEAFKLESYHQFLPPCLCETKDEYGGAEYGTCVSNATCTGGTPWSETGMKIMGSGLEGLKLNVVDSSHIVTEEKPSCHLPHIHGSSNPDVNPGNGKSPPLCSSPKNCVLNLTTVTQAIYQNDGEFDIWRITFNLSTFDTGYLPLAATELKAKLKSRQSVYDAAGIGPTDFTSTDKPPSKGGNGSRCGEINQAAIDWAMKALPDTTKSRFLKYGQQISIGEDVGTCIAGPCWIWDPLRWDEDKNTGAITVKSVWFGEENKNKYPCGELETLPCAAGMHYCKLLSPARVVEWAFVDGLRKNYGI